MSYLILLSCALLVKWYNGAMVRLNCKFDSYLGHHVLVFKLGIFSFFINIYIKGGGFMNAEIMKLRKNKGYDIDNYDGPKLTGINWSFGVIQDLNNNHRLINEELKNKDVDVNFIAELICKNIFMVLNVFSEMDVYPDYFYDVVFKEKIDFKRFCLENETMGISDLERMFNPNIRSYTKIRMGYENNYHHHRSSVDRDLNDYFVEMLSFYHAFNIPCGNNSVEQCRKSCKKLSEKLIGIEYGIYSSCLEIEYIEYFSSLLYEYISFLADVGISPYEFVDGYIEDLKKNGKNK